MQPFGRRPDSKRVWGGWARAAARGLLFALLLAASGAHAQSREIPWRGPAVFEMLAENKDLKSVLRSLTGSHGVTAVIDEDIPATPINGRFKLAPQSMLDFLCNSYGLIWFYDGSLLHIERASQAQNEVLRVNAVADAKVREMLRQLGAFPVRPPLQLSVNNGLVRVGGPRAFVKMVREAVRALDNPSGVLRDIDTRVYRLKYGAAADATFDVGGQTVRVPGVARLLAQLVGGQVQTLESASLDSIDPLASVPRRSYQPRGLPVPALIPEENAVQSIQRVQQEIAERTPRVGSAARNGGPQIVADPRTNAIIVRDAPERMSSYDELIRTLDVRQDAIEIEATIIEVASSALDELGVDWRFGDRRVAVENGAALPSRGAGRDLLDAGESWQPAPVPPPQLIRPLLGPGGTLSALLGDGGSYFLARIRALSEQGKASIESRPRVATLDNTAATIQHRRTFFVRVPGAYASSLFDVNVGLSLRVTPRLVGGNEGADRSIQLMAQIEDGEVTELSVDQIPIISTTSITAQAFIKPGEALLVAGFTQERLSNLRSGVPLLSRIPLLGAMFRSDNERKERVERVFILAPKLIPIDRVAAAVAAPPASE